MSSKFEKREKYILEGCRPTNAVEEVTVAVPVAVGAFADIGEISLKCCDPVIKWTCDDPPGRPGAISRFTVSQRLRVDIPMEFGVEAEVGEGCVKFDHDQDCDKDHDKDCDKNHDKDHDKDCNKRR